MIHLAFVIIVGLIANVCGKCSNDELIDGDKFYVCDPDDFTICECLESCSYKGHTRWVFTNEIGEQSVKKVCPEETRCYSGLQKCATRQEIDVHKKDVHKKAIREQQEERKRKEREKRSDKRVQTFLNVLIALFGCGTVFAFTMLLILNCKSYGYLKKCGYPRNKTVPPPINHEHSRPKSGAFTPIDVLLVMEEDQKKAEHPTIQKPSSSVLQSDAVH